MCFIINYFKIWFTCLFYVLALLVRVSFIWQAIANAIDIITYRYDKCNALLCLLKHQHQDYHQIEKYS